MSGQRGSEKYVLAANNDNDDLYIYIYIYMSVCVCVCVTYHADSKRLQDTTFPFASIIHLSRQVF